MTAVAEPEATIKPVYRDGYATVYHGDCLAVMRQMEPSSVDSVVTDPPYGLTRIDADKTRQAVDMWLAGDDEFVPDGRGFMNKEWDKFVPPPAVWKEAIRVLRPGGYLLCFAGSRTIDLMMLSVRMGGFEIAGTSEWAYGSGMPKSSNIGKAIDRRFGHVGKVVGTRQVDIGMQGGQLHAGRPSSVVTQDVTELSEIAKPWGGWGTALKPAREPIIVARKPGGDGDAVEVPAVIYTPKAGRAERPVLESDNGEIVAHATVKPVSLVEDLIWAVTPRGGVVLDPFLGSGTTSEAATTLGRDSIGIELEDAHIPLVIERLTGRDTWAGGLI